MIECDLVIYFFVFNCGWVVVFGLGIIVLEGVNSFRVFVCLIISWLLEMVY